MQESRPIAYFNQALSTRARAKSIYERELMAMVLVMKKWRHYLLGSKFTVISDQKALKFLIEQREVQPQFQKWLTKLLEYDFEILYQPGLQNKAADALSRMPTPTEIRVLTTTTLVDLEVVQQEVEMDKDLQNIIAKLKEDPDSVPKFSLERGRLLYKKRLVIPSTSSLIPSLLSTFHDSVIGGHSGFLRTYKRMTGELYWRGMKKDVKKYVESCVICQKNKSEAVIPAGLLQPLPIPEKIWGDITMDFVEGLPKSQGKDSIMVVVDRLSKYGHFIALNHPYNAKQVAQVFVREIVRLHGFPKSITSSRDKIFLNKFWIELFRS